MSFMGNTLLQVTRMRDSTSFACLHLIACKLWQSINPSLVILFRKRFDSARNVHVYPLLGTVTLSTCLWSVTTRCPSITGIVTLSCYVSRRANTISPVCVLLQVSLLGKANLHKGNARHVKMLGSFHESTQCLSNSVWLFLHKESRAPITWL